ncbi:phage-like element PBSX protein XkdT [Geomicrobium sp. JCM 19037]|uniref:putative phage tail protein n=1 Tax=Geomicrobium sp. JCM 19037 TaxID=1460634 RepID=UPI00045F1412|nr:putative phage tail protein [Geomicrobium sp. JCM 19037]GAK03243.1 phage-like element PBSX protein XkdT [Geomicrobium sp. JCM 19037]
MAQYKRDIAQSMYDSMPSYYGELRESRAIIDAEAVMFERLQDDTRDLLLQFSVNTATWGLANWERVFALDGDGLTYAERRSNIRARMRGAGIATVAHIKEVAESYDGGAVDVTEHYADYTVTITFVGTRGVPSNLADTERALREIIPAHLAVEFEFTYLTWDELEKLTWDFVETLTWDELETWRDN